MTKLMNALTIVLAMATAVAVVNVYNARAQQVPGLGAKVKLSKMAVACGNAAYIKAIAMKVHGKNIVAGGASQEFKGDQPGMVEVWVNKETDEFTLMVRFKDVRCLVIDGKGWTKIDALPLGEPG